MNHFDKEERQIYEAVSQIEVNHTDLAERVMQKAHSAPKMRVLPGRKRASLLAVALVLLLVSTAALAVGMGGFDWFMERFEPRFAEIVEPIEVYAEDQGIRMTVIGAQQFENMAIVYLSVQDISGENRLVGEMSFLDGFHLWGVDEYRPGMSWTQRMLYFDRETSTVYFEFQIIADISLTEWLEIGASRIFFDASWFWDEPVDLPLTNLSEMETISIEQEYMFIGLGDVPESLQVLIPGNIAPMPHGDPLQWISNIGIVDGQLRVQYGGCSVVRNRGLGPGDASFTLISPSGEVIQPVLGVSFFIDEDSVLSSVLTHWDDQNPAYRFEEYGFDVDLDRLPYYTLAYSGQAAFGIAGDWRVRVDTNDTSNQVLALTSDLSIDGFLFEFITLSPLGLQVRGSSLGSMDDPPGLLTRYLETYLETQEDIIRVDGGSGSYISWDQSFRYSWLFCEPIDINLVTAIVIDGHRIPVR